MIQCTGTLLVFSKPCHRWLFCRMASDALGGQRGSTLAISHRFLIYNKIFDDVEDQKVTQAVPGVNF